MESKCYVLRVPGCMLTFRTGYYQCITRNAWFDRPFDGRTVLSEVEGQLETCNDMPNPSLLLDMALSYQ
jgi:hypothetical protein